MARRIPASFLLSLSVVASVAAQPLPDSSITFGTHIAPLMIERCASCHNPDGPAPFSLLTYQDAKQRATQIAAVTKSRLMPPWKSEPGYGDFQGQHPLTDTEIALVQSWVAQGAPEGIPVGRRPPATNGWRMGTPDVVVRLAEPYRVPASGPEFSRVFVVPIPLSATQYVRGLEFRPGNPRVVHHANIRVDRTSASRALDEEDPAPGYEGLILRSASYPDGHFLGWTPGQTAPLLPPGLRWRLHPRSDVVIEVHMVPTGKPELVAPSIGFYFSAEGSARPAATVRLGRQNIDIPAGEKEYVSSDSFVLPVDVEVHAVQPHAHYRARQVKAIATLPDGTTKWLLYIKDWDFRWQHVYRYVTPFTLPRGTTLSMQYTYDNSAENPRNPRQPPTRVRWGQQSTSEMGDLWIQVATGNERDLAILRDAFEPKAIAEDIIGYETMIEENPSKASLHDDVAVLYLHQGRPQEASTHFEASVKLKPQSPSAHYNLATAFAAAGRLRAAADEFRAALDLRPDYAMAWNNLGNVYVRLGDFAVARQHFRQAVRVDPANAEAHYNLATMALADGDLANALAAFDRAAGLDPGWPLPLTTIAWLFTTTMPLVR